MVSRANSQAILAYGVFLPHGIPLPWGDKDPADWWIEDLCAFTPSMTEVESGKENDYWKKRISFTEKNPQPFQVEKSGDEDHPRHFLAVPGTVTRARDTMPFVFGSATGPGVCPSQENKRRLRELCSLLGITGELRWHLLSYWA